MQGNLLVCPQITWGGNARIVATYESLTEGVKVEVGGNLGEAFQKASDEADMGFPGAEPFTVTDSFKVDFHCDFDRELHQPKSVEEAVNTAKQLGGVHLKS